MYNSQSLFDFVKYCFHKWWLFLIIGVLAGVIGIFYAMKKPVIYESSLTFALDEGGSGGGTGGGLLGLASQFGFNIGGSNDVFSGDNIITIIKSRRMIEQTLLSVDTFENGPQTLLDYYLQLQNELDKDPDVPRFPPYQDRTKFTHVQDSFLYMTYADFYSNNLKIWKPDKYGNIFQVEVISTDERFTKIFTESIIAQTNTYYTEFKSKKSRETLSILEQRVGDMKGNLNSSIINKATAQDANINPAFASALIPAVQNQVKIQTYGEAYAEMFKHTELARFQYLKQIPLMQVIDAAQYPMHKIKQGKAKTAIIFSIAAAFLTLLVLWMIRVAKFYFINNTTLSKSN